MKTFTIATIMAGSMLLASTASAQEPPKQHINIESMLFEGRVQTPWGNLTNPTKRAQFKRMLRLKRSFIPKTLQDTNSPGLN